MKFPLADVVEGSSSALEVIWKLRAAEISIEDVSDDLIKVALDAIRGDAKSDASERVEVSESEDRVVTAIIR